MLAPEAVALGIEGRNEVLDYFRCMCLCHVRSVQVSAGVVEFARSGVMVKVVVGIDAIQGPAKAGGKVASLATRRYRCI